VTTAQTPPPPPPSESPAARPVKSSDEYFNSSRVRVIAMIVVATVAVGALGGLAGVLFDPEPVSKDHVRQPGVGTGARLAPQSLGGPGSSAPHRSHVSLPYAVRMPNADSTGGPAPVGSVSPGSESSPAATPTVGPTSQDGSQTATLESTKVDVYIPPGWTVDHLTDSQVYFSNGQGSFAWAFSGVGDPSTSAGDVITSALDDLLEYEALWVDNQGSMTIHGQLYVGVRQDGTVLGIEIEHMPAEDFPGSVEEMYPILDNSFGRFAGLGSFGPRR
jgi:hypothetical protein